MLNKDTAFAVIETALSTGGDFAEIFLEDRINGSVMMRSGKIENQQAGRLHGAGVRVFSGLSAVYVYTNDTGRDGLIACAKRAAAAVAGQERIPAAPFSERALDNRHIITIPPFSVTAQRKAEKLRAADAALRMYPEIVQAMISYNDSEQNVWICNSEGLFAHDKRVYSRFSVNAIASNGTENQSGRVSPGAMQGFELFDRDVDPEMCAHQAAKMAVTMLHAPACPAGRMPVVIDGGFGGVIFHEACGHSLEATSVAPGLSEFSGKLGTKIASEKVTAVDDGTIPNAWGSENIDDEGTPPTKLVLIENGILKNYMIDKLNARKM
ncbi:MAG: TldD/PmbA family protein, partial [Clostridia bacterium]|nr:TldD/PmbA family protein [Clostridia bacterium]